jgi:nucleoprotein TPR
MAMQSQKRVRVGEAFQGVSESGLDVEYQVPTSSQRDQDDIVVVHSDDDDEGMPDEGNAEVDEDPFDNDGNEILEMDDSSSEISSSSSYSSSSTSSSSS